jgi:hypothetical protein
VLAQRDDVYFVGAPEDVAAAYDVLRKGFAELDIEVQPTKSEIYAKDEALFSLPCLDFAANFAKSTEGMIVVGSPIGSKDFIDKEAAAVHRYPARYCGLPMAMADSHGQTRTFAKVCEAIQCGSSGDLLSHRGSQRGDYSGAGRVDSAAVSRRWKGNSLY